MSKRAASSSAEPSAPKKAKAAPAPAAPATPAHQINASGTVNVDGPPKRAEEAAPAPAKQLSPTLDTNAFEDQLRAEARLLLGTKEAFPFKVGEMVVVGKEKKECFVKRILPEQGCVLVYADIDDLADEGSMAWVDKDQCSRVLVDGKPVLEPKIEIKISFPNTKENSEPATSTATSGTSTLRRRTPEEMERIMAPYRKMQEDNKRRHEETFEKLESSKKAIVEKIRNLVGKDAINFQESVQSRKGYLCTISASEAPSFLNDYVDNEWTDDGGRKYGALPLRRLLQDCDAAILWEDNDYFITANVYKKHIGQKVDEMKEALTRGEDYLGHDAVWWAEKLKHVFAPSLIAEVTGVLEAKKALA